MTEGRVFNMKLKRNKRHMAFLVAISMFIGLLCGSEYAAAVSEKENSSIEIAEQHKKDGYVEAEKHEMENEIWTWKATGDKFILDATETNYGYMKLDNYQIDDIKDMLKKIYNFIIDRRKGLPWTCTKFTDDVNNETTKLEYIPDEIDAKQGGLLKYKNQEGNDIKNQREIYIEYSDNDDKSINAKLTENGNKIKTLRILNENKCEILDDGGKILYTLCVEDASKEYDYEYRIQYEKYGTNNSYIHLDKIKESGEYRLTATNDMIRDYGLSLWYKEEVKPTEEPVVTPTSIPTNKNDVTVSPLNQKKVKHSVSINMGGTKEYKKLLENNDINKNKIKVIIPKKYRELLKKSNNKQELNATYAKNVKITKKVKKVIKQGIPIKVKIGKGKPQNCYVKIKTPKPVFKVIKKPNGQFNKLLFKYNIKGAKKVKVRIVGSSKGVKRMLDKYVHTPKSNSNSWINAKKTTKRVTCKMWAYYGNKGKYIKSKVCTVHKNLSGNKK